MGLLQRSFLDLVEESQTDLQVALVVDGTDSMTGDISGVRDALASMVADLRRYKGDHVSLALVVYRDVGSPSGPVTQMVSQFTADVDALNQAFANIQPESGAPYFLEATDLGIHEALDKLNWSTDETTTRWLLVFGDAPPYDPDFDEAKTGAKRYYDTDLLINLAKRKGIQISSVLCTSDGPHRQSYDAVLAKTRGFMNALAGGTRGLMLDLSYPDIRKALVDSAKSTRVEYQRIGKITRTDVEQAREAAKSAQLNVSEDRRVTLAILPHMPIPDMDFDPHRSEVHVATELRQKFKQFPNIDVKNPVDVQRQLRAMRSQNLSQDQMLKALALRLRVDYVVWGSYKSAAGIVAVKSNMYAATTGRALAKQAESITSANVPEVELVSRVVDNLAQNTIEANADPVLTATFVAYRNDQQARGNLLVPVATNSVIRSDLLTGFEALEQALAYPTGDSEAKRLLDVADDALAKAAMADVRNPFVYLLQANCYFNQAQLLNADGQRDAAAAKAAQYIDALKRAFRTKDQTRQEEVRAEIEADYALLVTKDYASAISSYESLTRTDNQGKLQSALRAHWMLAGIYSGDWGVTPEFIDPVKARHHLIQILAHWESSSEAAFIQKNLRWDGEDGENKFEHFPKQNELILAGLL